MFVPNLVAIKCKLFKSELIQNSNSNNLGEVSLEIFNTSGQKVYSSLSNSDLPSLPLGIYIYRQYDTATNVVTTGKVIFHE